MGAYALFLGVVIPAPVRYTGFVLAGRVTASMVVAVVLIAGIVALAALYLRRSGSE
jgi:hypothetical protein